ncbi:MAG TPA: glycosyltransferase family 2 protein [Gemmatimonadaceae bacterium]|jgi:glycosyltransferase involved in cell wall biosynthesis|nr:glycosyltransferase family 2 protein [Gemmatimonadaceae bacterium]
MDSAVNPSITILIPTYNRIRALEAVWPSYFGHHDVARIIVIDDGSTDGTRERVLELAADRPIPVDVIRHETQQGQPAARRTGIAAARTEWVLFGEDDVWLADDYCSTLLREAKELAASVIAGRLVTARVPDKFSRELLVDEPQPVRDASQVFDLSSMDADFSARTERAVPAPFVHSIALIKRDLFDTVSFDTWYAGNSWREETDFYLAANSIGARAYFTPETVCFHLRGPICASGGQRINRLVFELLAWRNTNHLVSKHWSYLRRAYGMRGPVTLWMVRYYFRRQMAQLKRMARHGMRSTYDG